MVMFYVPPVWIETIGICGRCGFIFTFQDIIGNKEKASMKLICGGCSQALGFEDFGFAVSPTVIEINEASAEIKLVKIKWINQDGNWTLVKPRKNFYFFNWHVVLTPQEAGLSAKLEICVAY